MSEASVPPGPHVTGQLFVARIEYLRQHHGPEAIARVMAALSEEDRERLRGVGSSGWYPFGMVIRFDRAVALLLAPGDGAIFERLGAASAQIRNEWLGEHASLVSPHGFLSRVADEHRRFHTFGRVAYQRTGFTDGELSFADYPEKDATYCLGAMGYLKRSLEVLTSGPVRIEEPECQCRGDARCLFSIQWTQRHSMPSAGGAS
jgi:uncharacterized protein (TIGR02265 family)